MNEETCWRLPLRSLRAASRARERSRIASCRSSDTQTAVSSPGRGNGPLIWPAGRGSSIIVSANARAEASASVAAPARPKERKEELSDDELNKVSGGAQIQHHYQDRCPG